MMTSAPKTTTDDADWDLFFGSLKKLLAFEQEQAIRPRTEPQKMEDTLPLTLGASGKPLDAVVDAMMKIAYVTPHTSSGQFFNQLFGGRVPAATMADILAAVLNNSMYTYKVAGPQVLVERTLIDRMCALAGFPEGNGSFTPGGSMSNLLAMIVAREERIPKLYELRESRPLAYTSDLGHYSVSKNAMFVGIGRANLRKVPTDSRGRMIPTEFEKTLAEDVGAGHSPYFLNITSGSTVLGAFDPIEALTEIAHRHGVWVHVDGAFGGSLLLSPTHRHKLAGLDAVDSFTWDAHKLMGVPLTSSICIFRNGDALGHLSENAEYLFQGKERDLDPGHISLQCGRRNDALKVWAAWQFYGDEGYAERIDGMMAMAQYAAEKIKATPGLTLKKNPESVNICFSADGVDAPAICKALYDEELAMVGYATVDGEVIVRLALAAPTTREALDIFFENTAKIAASLQ